MREVIQHEPGTFCWPELATTNADSAKALYGALFDWTFDDQSPKPSTTYTIARRAGKDVAALYVLQESQRQRGVVAHWNSYAAVKSADESALRVKVLGGTIFEAPFDVGPNGRMAIVKDPQGATLCLWEARAHPGAQIVGELGPAERTDLADDLRPPVSPRLPEAERRALGVFHDRHAPVRPDVERRPDGRPAKNLRAECALVGALHRRIGVPVGEDAELPLRLLEDIQRGHVLARAPRDRVRGAGLRGLIVEGPAEEGAVQHLRRIDIRRRELGPAERAGLVLDDLSHRLPPGEAES